MPSSEHDKRLRAELAAELGWYPADLDDARLAYPCRGVTQSMGRTGSALDNAVSEAFNSTLEWELLRGNHFATREQARHSVATWIDEYNNAADGSPPYVVRWLATGHVATVVPGPDAIVVTPEEQEAADERAQERAAHRGTNE